ncbi:immunoglobulin A1 protease isoform X2 [Etheostoma cragini]|uniref:immunoglobulin A1 protease isoform X2 n=1 Tax=Etheostoma cragini TaxID=417921 RepID=UPI00155E9E76|nr:immunoglobulin A1 protease isoform X2 [Etheostoma cragini]
MEYCFLKGFLVVLLMQHCRSEVVTLQDGPALPQEPELPHAEVVPVVAPPSLKEVQQAVQEASEQVEGRGAEEVLKELLERVVEAAMGQVEGGGEAKVDEAAVHDAFEEDALGAKKGEMESDTEAEVSEQTVEEEVEAEDMVGEGGDTGAGEEQEIAKVDAFEDEVEEGKGAAKGMEETVAGFVQDTTADVKTGGREAEGVEVIGELPDTKVSQEFVEEAVAALEETRGYLAVEETGVEDSNGQVVLWKEKEASESETKAVEEVSAVVDVGIGGEPEEETIVDSDPSLAVADVEQLGDAWGKEETQVDDVKGEVIVPHFDNYERETTQTVAVEVEDEEKVNIVKDAEGLEVDNEHGHLVVEGGDVEEVKAEGAKVGEAEGGEINRGSVIKEESGALVNEVSDHQAGEEEQIASETSLDSEKEDQEVLVISAPKPLDSDEASIEKSPENQAPTPRPSLGGGETKEATLGDEKSNNGNEIINTTDDLLPHDPVVAQPTLDNFVKDFPAEPPQAEGEEPGEANELVEDTAGNTDTSELGLEAWKIGAISAAAFLVLETVIIIIYVLKHPSCNKNSVPALQRACEEGCVEPEAATGGDCSDDTLPASNGDAQQIAAHDPFDVASTLAQNKEQHEDELAIAMSDLPPSSAEESVNTGPGPDSSQDLRTSIL